MNTYKALHNQVFTSGEYSLVPIRMEDRHAIRKWRNEQLHHLRQKEPLTREQQDRYFNTVVASLFDQEKPDQILFSFLKKEECIGYGGLVHINWTDRNAEISFVMDTSLEKDHFQEYWGVYLGLIEEVAFGELNLHKVYTWAFDLRPYLYDALVAYGFDKEAQLRGHCLIDETFHDVLIHSKFNREIRLRAAIKNDEEVTFKWASDPVVRKFSMNNSPIKREDHENWFKKKLTDGECKFLIAECSGVPIGSFRIDSLDDGSGRISYLLDPRYHGKGMGKQLMESGIRYAINDTPLEYLIGEVHQDNIPSIRIFQDFGFTEVSEEGNFKTFEMKIR